MRCITTLTLAISLLMANLHSIEIQAHRGARDTYSENTLAAFQAAWEAGADAVELDVQITSDGILIVHHDYSLNPALSCYLDGSPIEAGTLIHTIPLSEVKKIDCGCKADPRFPGQTLVKGTQIPTLEELIDFINASPDPRAQKIRLNIELKRDPRAPHLSLPPQQIVDLVVAEVERKGFAHKVLYSSFDPEILVALRQKAPEAVISCLFSQDVLKEISKRYKMPGMDFVIGFSSDLQAQILSPHHTMLKHASQVRAMHEAGFKVVVWTVNDPIRWKELYDMGVDGIITDTPSALAAFLEDLRQKELEEEKIQLTEGALNEPIQEDLSTGTDSSRA